MNAFDGAYSYRQVFDVAMVQGEVYKKKGALRATRLPLVHGVLHLYLCYNYLPRTSCHSSITLSNLWAMSKLLDGKLISFWDIMVTNFKRVANNSQPHLLWHSRLIIRLLQRKGIQFSTTSQFVTSEDFTMRHITKTDWTGDRLGSLVLLLSSLSLVLL